MEFRPWRYVLLFGLTYLAGCRLFFWWVPKYHGDDTIFLLVVPILVVCALFPAYAAIRHHAKVRQLVVLWIGSGLSCIAAWVMGMGWLLSVIANKENPGVEPWTAIGTALTQEPEALLIFGIASVFALLFHLFLLLAIYLVLLAFWTWMLRDKAVVPGLARDPRQGKD